VKHLCVVAAGLLAALAFSPAQAQFRLGGGVEYFTWSEDTNPSVEETGPLLVLHLGYLQSKPRGLLFGYAGRLYFGDVDYEGATLAPPFTPIASTTRYTGMSNEAQLRYRLPPSRGYWLDFTSALGLDVWQRELSSVQKEDWRVGYLRLGVDLDTPADQGFVLGAGFKYPVYTWEDAHFTSAGFDRNPTLEPGKEWSVYAQVGYRFRRNWQVIGYMDSHRFSESNYEFLVSSNPALPSGLYGQPPSTMYTWGIKLEYLFR
jgi:hypothetical protein